MTLDQKYNQRKIYRVEKLGDDGRWVEAAPRQPSIEKAAVVQHRLRKRGIETRVVEMDP